jgi:hypothetical protein
MPTYNWWSIEFIAPTTGAGYMKMLDGVCQNIYTETGTVVNQDNPLEYTCTSMDVAAPSWYNASTNTP